VLAEAGMPLRKSCFLERAMGIEPTSEIWVHAATSRARLYRNGRTKVAASVHCRPPATSECAGFDFGWSPHESLHVWPFGYYRGKALSAEE
jgi:hypothetical protein